MKSRAARDPFVFTKANANRIAIMRSFYFFFFFFSERGHFIFFPPFPVLSQLGALLNQFERQSGEENRRVFLFFFPYVVRYPRGLCSMQATVKYHRKSNDTRAQEHRYVVREIEFTGPLVRSLADPNIR